MDLTSLKKDINEQLLRAREDLACGEQELCRLSETSQRATSMAAEYKKQLATLKKPAPPLKRLLHDMEVSAQRAAEATAACEQSVKKRKAAMEELLLAREQLDSLM